MSDHNTTQPTPGSPVSLELRAAATALQFLTVAPPLLRRPLQPQELGRAIAYYPLVGLLIGGVLAALHWVLSLVLPASVSAALVLAAWVAVTRGFHFDGFLDCCDGLFGGYTADDRLRIMRDHHVGAFGVAGGVLLLLVLYTALAASARPLLALVLAPVLGRWTMASAVVAYPYARANGLGRDIKDNADWQHWLIATVTALVVVLVWGGTAGLLAMAAAALLLVCGSAFVSARLPGLTGDVYGAIIELAETAALVAGCLLIGG